MEGPVPSLPCSRAGFSSLGKGIVLGGATPHELWRGEAACLRRTFPQLFSPLLNKVPLGKESSALYKQPGVRVAQALRRKRGDD